MMPCNKDTVYLHSGMSEQVWGGGIYEPDCFYDAADEYGILIYHDLQFAVGNIDLHEIVHELFNYSSAYQNLSAVVERETTYQVRRLQHHPSRTGSLRDSGRCLARAHSWRKRRCLLCTEKRNTCKTRRLFRKPWCNRWLSSRIRSSYHVQRLASLSAKKLLMMRD